MTNILTVGAAEANAMVLKIQLSIKANVRKIAANPSAYVAQPSAEAREWCSRAMSTLGSPYLEQIQKAALLEKARNFGCQRYRFGRGPAQRTFSWRSQPANGSSNGFATAPPSLSKQLWKFRIQLRQPLPQLLIGRPAR
jgi:hypothetical protein